MRDYKKKPVVIQAEQLTLDNAEELANACGGRTEYKHLPASVSLTIPTLEGNMRAGMGDYIIRGVKGEFYPCKEDIFHQTYEVP